MGLSGKRVIAGCAALLLSAVAYAQVKVFGVTMDQPLRPLPHHCPVDPDKSKAICWIDPPYVAPKTGGRLGYVHLPDPDLRPTWATYAMFEIELSKDGSPRRIEVRAAQSDKHTIAQSITKRWGLPLYTSLAHVFGPTMAEWRSAEGYVRMLCDGHESCRIAFWSPVGTRERDELIHRREAEAARKPVTP